MLNNFEVSVVNIIFWVGLINTVWVKLDQQKLYRSPAGGLLQVIQKIESRYTLLLADSTKGYSYIFLEYSAIYIEI